MIEGGVWCDELDVPGVSVPELTPELPDIPLLDMPLLGDGVGGTIVIPFPVDIDREPIAVATGDV